MTKGDGHGQSLAVRQKWLQDGVLSGAWFGSSVRENFSKPLGEVLAVAGTKLSAVAIRVGHQGHQGINVSEPPLDALASFTSSDKSVPIEYRVAGRVLVEGALRIAQGDPDCHETLYGRRYAGGVEVRRTANSRPGSMRQSLWARPRAGRDARP